MTVRLVGGSTKRQGRLEVLQKGLWREWALGAIRKLLAYLPFGTWHHDEAISTCHRLRESVVSASGCANGLTPPALPLQARCVTTALTAGLQGRQQLSQCRLKPGSSSLAALCLPIPP